MYYEVYIDQLFLENLVILVLLQKLGGKLMKRVLSWKRIWLVSGMGAAVMCAVIFFRPFGRWMMVRRFGLLPVILLTSIGLRCRNWKEVCRGTFYLLAAAAFFDGIFQIIFSIWEPPALLAAVLGYTALDILIDMERKRMVLEEYRTEVILEDRGNRWTLTGLIDTGNHLTEPLTGRPVSILDWQEAEKMQRFSCIQKEGNGYLYIPYHSIGTEHGWMMGMVIDAMYMEYGGEKIRIDHPVLAISREKLSPKGRYQMILNPMQVTAMNERAAGRKNLW